jgi:hypothetical protein
MDGIRFHSRIPHYNSGHAVPTYTITFQRYADLCKVLGVNCTEDVTDTLIKMYVIDHIVSHGRSENDEVIMRVRWSGYYDADDIWERVEDLPREIVEAYARRKKLPSSTVGF